MLITIGIAIKLICYYNLVVVRSQLESHRILLDCGDEEEYWELEHQALFTVTIFTTKASFNSLQADNWIKGSRAILKFSNGMYPGEPDHTTRADVESSRGGPLRLHPAFPRAPLAPSPYTEEVDLDCWSGVVVVVVYPPSKLDHDDSSGVYCAFFIYSSRIVIDDIHSGMLHGNWSRWKYTGGTRISGNLIWKTSPRPRPNLDLPIDGMRNKKALPVASNRISRDTPGWSHVNCLSLSVSLLLIKEEIIKL